MNLMCIEVYNRMCAMSMTTLITLEVKFYSAVLCEGLGLGLETKEPRSWSWSRDQGPKVLVLVSRPECQGLGLEFFKKVLTTTLIETISLKRFWLLMSTGKWRTADSSGGWLWCREFYVSSA